MSTQNLECDEATFDAYRSWCGKLNQPAINCQFQFSFDQTNVFILWVLVDSTRRNVLLKKGSLTQHSRQSELFCIYERRRHEGSLSFSRN